MLVPFATYRPITVNYTSGRDGKTPILIVDHVADGYGSPFTWFNTDRGDDGSSAHFWVSRKGEIEQYRPLTDTCWANGPKKNPDLSNPIIKALVDTGSNPNPVSVAIEHEGKPEDGFTDEQMTASRRLHIWVGQQYRITLDRTHVIGHSQLDSITRARCPGPLFPWAKVLDPTFDVSNCRDTVWALADDAEKNGYPWLATALRAVVVLSKGEK